MVFYQVSLKDKTGESFGYEYFATQREAVYRRSQWILEEAGDGATAIIRSVNVSCSKAGVLKALNKYASHHDNG